jgi:sugar phosphate isomerase/epimerase
MLDWVARVNARRVVLDITAPGFRPRELDTSARRDIVAVLRRSGIECRGLDAFIPPSHFTDPSTIDRAVSALIQAMEMASDISRLTQQPVPVCTALSKEAGADVIGRLLDASQRVGCALADCGWPIREINPRLELGVDPATVLAGGGDPCDAVLKADRTPSVARLSDLSAAGRCEPGEGGLDLLRYEVALVTRGYAGCVVVDLRGVRRQAVMATRCMESD